MKTLRSSRRAPTALLLALATLIGACAQPPSPSSKPESPTAVAEPPAPQQKASSVDGNTAAPPPLVPGSMVPLQPDHPQTYTVASGDTLWSIAQRFLKNPWQWREIWRQNPQLRNPNRIYPGDVLQFSQDANGAPQLQVAEHEDVPLVKLSPQTRAETLVQPIPPVPRSAVESFLTRALILSEAEWRRAPYILDNEDAKSVATNRDRIYVRGTDFDQPRYQVFRQGEELREPSSGRSLGIAGTYLGEAVLERNENPATFILANTIAPVRAGDRLFPIEAERELYNFDPHPVPPDTEGFILTKLDSEASQITQYSSVVINLGAQEGLEPGHVLAIFGRGRETVDPVTGADVKIPGEREGLLMIYKVHDLVSYGLVMQADRFIHVQDRVTTP